MRGHVRKRRTLGVHRRCRSSSRDRQTTPEEQVRVCSKEGGRKRSARLYPLRRRWGRSVPGPHHPCGAPQSLDRIPGCPGHSLAHLGGLRGHFRREIVPVIGGLEIAKLRPGHVRAVLAGMQRRGLSACHDHAGALRSRLGSPPGGRRRTHPGQSRRRGQAPEATPARAPLAYARPARRSHRSL